MKDYIAASEKILELAQQNTSSELPGLLSQYAIKVLAKYFEQIPQFNSPTFGMRLMSQQSTSECLDLAEDSLMYGTIFSLYTARKLGRGGVRYVRDISQISYSRAGLEEITSHFDVLCSVLSAINTTDDVGTLLITAKSGDMLSKEKLREIGILVL